MASSDDASDYFARMIGEYDSLIGRAVPGYGEMTDRLLAYLPAWRGRAGQILELGCGTGNLTVRLARAYPGASITTVDASAEMTALAAGRVAALAGGVKGEFADAVSVKTLTSRFEDLAFESGSFDLVTSCISLHHVEDKGNLYRSLRTWLSPGGTFRFADQLRGSTEEVHGVNWSRWLEHCREGGEAGRCSEEEIASLLEHAEAHDHYTPLIEHFQMLASAGFDASSLDCVWRNWIWGIVVADV